MDSDLLKSCGMDTFRRQFHCLGSESVNSHNFHPQGFVKGNELVITEEKGYIYLFDKKYVFKTALITNSTDLFNNCRLAFMLLDKELSDCVKRRQSSSNESSIQSKTLMSFRDDINLFFIYVHTFLKCFEADFAESEVIAALEVELWKLRLLFHKLPCVRLPDSALAFYASSLGDCSLNPVFQLVHCHLNVRWLFIKIIEKLDIVKKKLDSNKPFSSSLNSLCVEEEVMMLMFDLLWLSIVRYEKCEKTRLVEFSAFGCVCIKELWLLLMHYPYRSQDFWTFLNQTLRIIIDNIKPPESVHPNALRMSPPEFLPCSNRNEFALWMLSDLARIQQYDSQGNIRETMCDVTTNFELLEDIVKACVRDDVTVTEESMRSLIPMLQKIHSSWNHSKSSIILTLWEYYHKKINSAFYVPGSKLNSMVVMSKSGPALLEQVQSRLSGTLIDKYENSFLMFLRFIGEHLKAQCHIGGSIPRLCGRIFIKFPVSKVDRLKELQDVGVFHLSSLYLTLALGSSNATTVSKLVELLAAIPRDDIKEGKHEMIWKGYAAALIALESMRADMTEAIHVILEHFRWCNERYMLAPVSHLVDATKHLFKKDVASARGVHQLIGPWMETYMKGVSKSDGARVVHCFMPLLNTLKGYGYGCNGSAEIHNLQTKVEEYLPNILSGQMNLITAEVAALFTVISSSHRSQLFDVWTDCQDCSLSSKYLCTLLLLGKDIITMYLPQAPVLSIQVWIRCVFLYGHNEDTTNLMKVVREFPQFAQLKIDWTDQNAFTNFIEYFGTEYSLTAVLHEKSTLRETFSSYFHKFDRWLEGQLKQMEILPADVINRLYRYSAELFAKCPNLIYTRSNPRSLLKTIVDTLLLFPQIYKHEYRPPRSIIKAVTDYLALFLQGLLILDPECDAYVARLLRDIVLQYVPRLSEVPTIYHPLVILLSNSISASRISKVLVTFLQVKKQSVHPQASHILKLFQQAGSSASTHEAIFEGAVVAIIDLLIILDDLHPVKSKALDYLASALTSVINRRILSQALTEACKKQMAFNSGPWFRTVTRIFPLCKEELQILPAIAEREIAAVEKRRGVKSDTILRNHLQNMKKTMGLV